jgi:hypothetical protein
VDNGLFPELAVTLSKSFGKTFYYSAWETAFPRTNAMILGDGIPGVTRVNSIFPIIDEVDLFVFPDILHGPLQVYLHKQGKRVWGSRLAENLETLRGLSKRWIRDAGLAVGPYRQIRGVAKLREFLKENDNQFVKISRTRGDMETFHAPTYKLIEPRLDELEHALGAAKNGADFVVEGAIEAEVEVGYDGYCIDGEYPSTALFGVESKDAAYVGEVRQYDKLPDAVQVVNDKISNLLKSFTYRGFWSSEIRVAKDKTPYLIDPCCRMASPPGELYLYMIENIAEIIWEGAAGNLVEPKFKDKWGAQLVMRSSWAEENWQPIDFPKSLRDNVKLHYLTQISGRNYFIPQAIGMPEIGSVVATGPTKEAAMKEVAKISEYIEGYGIKFDLQALDSAGEKMDQFGLVG